MSSSFFHPRNNSQSNKTKNDTVLSLFQKLKAEFYFSALVRSEISNIEKLAGKLRGIDVYFAPKSSQSEKLANIIANNLKAIYPLPDKVRALPTNSLGEVLRTKAVAVLCELGYHDNYADEAWLKNNLENIARNITTGGSGLNIRRYPSINGAIIGSMPDGATVTINGETNGWYVVNYNGIIGYASSRYITI